MAVKATNIALRFLQLCSKEMWNTTPFACWIRKIILSASSWRHLSNKIISFYNPRIQHLIEATRIKNLWRQKCLCWVHIDSHLEVQDLERWDLVQFIIIQGGGCNSASDFFIQIDNDFKGMVGVENRKRGKHWIKRLVWRLHWYFKHKAFISPNSVSKTDGLTLWFICSVFVDK